MENNNASFRETIKRDWYMLLIVLAGFVIGAVFYPRLPAVVPTHWNGAGDPNGYGPKFVAAFLPPVINLAIYAAFILAPRIDPSGRNYYKFGGSYQLIKVVVMTLIFVIHTSALFAAVGAGLNLRVVTRIGLSLLFIIFGNVMTRFRHNYFVGIKTPWTLASEEVWRRTHRMAGPIWVIGGIVNLVFSFFTGAYYSRFLIAVIIVIAGVPIVYSYIIYKKLDENG